MVDVETHESENHHMEGQRVVDFCITRGYNIYLPQVEMGLLFSKLLNKLGLLSDEDYAEQLLEDAAHDVHHAASIAKHMSPYRSDPEYAEQVRQANHDFAKAAKHAREIITSLKPSVLSSVQKRRHTMKHSSHRSSHTSPQKSMGGQQTVKRARHARYSQRASR
jgi:hypothetical protein